MRGQEHGARATQQSVNRGRGFDRRFGGYQGRYRPVIRMKGNTMYENKPNVSEMVAALSSGDSVKIDGETYTVCRHDVAGYTLGKGKREYTLNAVFSCSTLVELDGLRIRSNGGRGRPLDKVVSSFEHVRQTTCDGGTGPDCVPGPEFRIEFTADTEGNWCSQCATRLYATREEAEAAIAADVTARPDIYGNVCQIEIVEVINEPTQMYADEDMFPPGA